MIHKTKTAYNRASTELLLKMLKSAQLTKAQSKKFLHNHKNSLDSYLYKFIGPVFPSSFSYFFLNAISAHKPLPNDRRSKSKKYAYMEDLQKIEKNSFHKILKKYENLEVKNKLILPCLIHHCSILIKLSNSEFLHDNLEFESIESEFNQDLESRNDEGENNFLNQYIDEVLPGVREYLQDNEEITAEDKVTATSEQVKIVDYKILIDSVRFFFPHLEVLRKKYLPNFVAPNETFKLPVLNSNEKVLFSKSFVKRNLNLKKYNDLVLMNVGEDNMNGTINKGDLALIIKLENKVKPKLNNGIYAVNLNNKIVIRRLYFSEFSKRTLVHIISDNKIYGGEQVLLENVNIFGEVVWKCNNFQDIQFLKHEGNEPDLFSNEDIEIPEFIKSKKIDKEIA